MNCITIDEAAIAAAIAVNTKGITIISDCFMPSIPLDIFAKLNDTTAKVAAMNTAVNAWFIVIGIMNCITAEAAAIATAIAVRTKGILITSPNLTFLIPLTMFSIPCDTTAKVPAIRIAVKPCAMDMG